MSERRELSPALSALFGDRAGFVLFLGTLLVASLGWKVGFFITDTYTLANGVVNLAHGHLEIRQIRYSLTLGSLPGIKHAGDAIYARNYGQLFLAVPLFWALKLLSAVVDLRVSFVAGYSLGILAFAYHAGHLFDRRRTGAMVGSLAALSFFFGNLAVATDLSTEWLAVLALQLLGVGAAGVTTLLLYRLLERSHGRTVGVTIGAAVAVASPVFFWASIPKRHVLTAALTLLVVWGFATSRNSSDDLGRWMAYVAVAVTTWIHAYEGFILLMALLPIDLATASSNDRKRIATLVVVFMLALTPFLLTNLAVSGSALTPPRLVDEGAADAQLGPGGKVTAGEASSRPTRNPATDTDASTTVTRPGGDQAPAGTTVTKAAPPSATDTPDKTTTPASPGESSTTEGVLDSLLPSALVTVAGMAWKFGSKGVRVVVDQPDRVYQTFVRSSRLPNILVSTYAEASQHERIDLTVLESTPALAVLSVLPFIGARRFVTSNSRFAGVRSALRQLRTAGWRRQTDLLVGALAVTFSVFYMPRLPLVGQITVRYLLPIVPLGLYGVGRIGTVRRTIADAPAWLAGSYLVLVTVGAPFVVAAVSVLHLAIGEAIQFHALLGLTAAAVATGTTLVATLDDVDARLIAVALATPAATATVTLGLMQLEYFEYGSHLLPAVRVLARAIDVIP